MALSSGMLFEFRTTGDPNNGAGFKVGATGVDYSQQDAAQKSNTDLVLVTATTMTSAGSAFDANDVGNVIRISAGTGFTLEWFEITSVAAGVATVDRSAGTGGSTGGTFKVGGALSTFQDAFLELMPAAAVIHIKDGNYTVTEAINVAKDGGTGGNPITLEGYSSSRGDKPTGSTRPNIDCGANSWLFDDGYVFKYIDWTGTHASGWRADTSAKWVHCKATNTSGSANANAISIGGTGANLISVETVSTLGQCVEHVGAGADTNLISCYLHDSVDGYSSGGNISTCNFINCVFDTLSGTAIAVGTNNTLVMQCTLYGGSTAQGTAFSAGALARNILLNNIFKNWTLALNATATLENNLEDFNSFHGNTTDRTNWNTGANSITADPSMVDPANANFTLNTGSPAIDTGLDIFGTLL